MSGEATDKYPLTHKTYLIIGIAMEIHRQLGSGFAEVVYKDAFEYECKLRNVFYEREKEYAVKYKAVILAHKFYADFVVYNKIIVEIKCKKGIIEEHYGQVMNYLAISSIQVGLLINFHGKSLEYKRVVKTQ